MGALIRDPAEWATDSGWVSRRRAVNLRRRLDHLAECINGAMGGDEGADMWIAEIRKIAAALAPAETPAEKEARRVHALD